MSDALRWLEWLPKAQIFQKTAESVPSKPSEKIIEGFEGAHPAVFQNIELPEGAVPLVKGDPRLLAKARLDPTVQAMQKAFSGRALEVRPSYRRPNPNGPPPLTPIYWNGQIVPKDDLIFVDGWWLHKQELAAFEGRTYLKSELCPITGRPKALKWTPLHWNLGEYGQTLPQPPTRKEPSTGQELTVGLWRTDCCIPDGRYETTPKALYASFCAWLTANQPGALKLLGFTRNGTLKTLKRPPSPDAKDEESEIFWDTPGMGPSKPSKPPMTLAEFVGTIKTLGYEVFDLGYATVVSGLLLKSRAQYAARITGPDCHRGKLQRRSRRASAINGKERFVDGTLDLGETWK